MLVEEFGRTVRTCGPRQRRNRVDDLGEIALARKQRLFRALPIVDVDVQGVPADNAPVGVAQRQPANLKPTISPVSAAKSLFGVVGSPVVVECKAVSRTF